jgi:hypothetical protein
LNIRKVFAKMTKLQGELVKFSPFFIIRLAKKLFLLRLISNRSGKEANLRLKKEENKP